MINVKDQVYSALLGVTENVSDLYPRDPAEFPAIQYTEEANNVITKTDDREQYAQLRYRIDIWSNGSTSDLALAVDEALSPLGLTRTQCEDIADPSNYRHKQMRYEGVIDVNTERVFWTQNQ